MIEALKSIFKIFGVLDLQPQYFTYRKNGGVRRRPPLRGPHKFSTQTIIGLWIVFILLGAFFLRKIFILPSIIKQAITLKEKISQTTCS